MACEESFSAGCTQEREDAVCVTMNYIYPLEMGVTDYTDEKHNHHSQTAFDRTFQSKFHFLALVG